MVLSWIIATSVAGGLISLIAAASFAFGARGTAIPVLISYAIGALLGAAFLEILPHAFSLAGVENMAATVLAGLLVFFVLEKLVLWRHCHGNECEAHGIVDERSEDRSGIMIIIGDTFHNFVDGILIAAAFMADIQLGLLTSLAIIAHEIPQEIGDFLILLHSGYTKKQAFFYNGLSSFATVVGGVLAYFALQTMAAAVPTILGLAAASMIYVAVADLIPGLHKRVELAATVQQVLLIALGISSIWMVKYFLGDLA
mgnify:CR=1 FL=1